MIPFAVLLAVAVLVYFWHQRSRENEALAEYPKALLALADRPHTPSPEAEEMRKMAWAVSQSSAKAGVWQDWTADHREEVRKHLASASSPFLIQEAGMLPGTPRHRFTYAAVMRRLGRLTR